MSKTKVNVLAKLSGLRPSKTRAEIFSAIADGGIYHFFSDRTSFGRRKLDAARELEDAGIVEFERTPESSTKDNWYVLRATPAALAAFAAFDAQP